MGDSLESLDPLIEELFVAGRGPVNRQIVDPLTLNFNALGHFGGDWRAFEELRLEIDQTMNQGGWIIYMIHGVGEGTHQMFMDDEEHRKLVNFLGERRDEIWSSPVVEVARYLKNAN